MVSKHDVRVEPRCYAIDARPDRSRAVVTKSDGEGVELVAARPGVEWLTEAFEDKAEKLPIIVDKNGPASGQADRLEAAGFEIVRLDSLAVRKACGRFYDAVIDARVRVRADERLDSAVAHAVQKSTADSWAWNRDAEGGELLMAISLAFSYTPQSWTPMVGTV